MGFTTFEQQERAIAAARFENAKRLFLINVYKKYLHYLPCQSNDQMLLNIVAEYVGSSDVYPTVELLEAALDLNPEEAKTLARTSTGQQLENIADDYVTLLAAHSKQSEHTLRLERTKMLNTPLVEARQKLADLKLRQNMAARPTAELHQIVRDAQPTYGYPALPPTIFEDGKFITIDADYLKKCSGWAFKMLCKKYGEKAVMNRRGK